MGIFYTRFCNSQVRLDGKTAVITGCNTGIGKATAMDFYKRGARVVMACRSLEKAAVAAKDIRKQCEDEPNTGEILIVQLDLSSLKSVRNCAQYLNQSETRINLLINNAGVMACPPQIKTEDGFGMEFGTNHLGHFLFTLLLLPKIIKSAPSRIVNVSSWGHTGGTINFEDLHFEKSPYSAVAAYAQSKLANVLFTKDLARRLKAAGIENITTYSLHPGVVATDIVRYIIDTKHIPRYGMNILKWFLKTPEQGAQTTIFCAVDESVANESGYYYSDCARKDPAKNAKSVEDAEKLWNVCLKLVGLDEHYNPFKLH